MNNAVLYQQRPPVRQFCRRAHRHNYHRVDKIDKQRRGTQSPCFFSPYKQHRPKEKHHAEREEQVHTIVAGQPVLVQQQRLGSHCRKAKRKTAKALFQRQAGLLLRHIPAEHQKDGGKKYPVPGMVKKLEQQPVKVLYDRHPRGYPVVAVTKQAN